MDKVKIVRELLKIAEDILHPHETKVIDKELNDAVVKYLSSFEEVQVKVPRITAIFDKPEIKFQWAFWVPDTGEVSSSNVYVYLSVKEIIGDDFISGKTLDYVLKKLLKELELRKFPEEPIRKVIEEVTGKKIETFKMSVNSDKIYTTPHDVLSEGRVISICFQFTCKVS